MELLKLVHFIFVITFLVCAASKVNAQCKLTEDIVRNEPRIFGIIVQGQLLPLRQDTVAVGTILYLFCNKNPPITRTCQSNGKFDKTLPVGRCPDPIQASVELGQDSNCRYQSYRVGYRINDNFLELYRSCYDKDHVRSLYTVHDAWHYNIAISRPELSFTTDRIISGADAASFKSSSIFNRFNELLGAQQRYVTAPNHIVFDRGHLTPSADYLFMENMRATFKYINAIPQFSSINRGNWVTIENFVRNRVASASGYATVMTGASEEVLQLRDANNNLVNMYLAAPNKNPIPKWIYKIYNDNRGRIIFITYNNIFDNRCPVAPCKTVNCPIQLSSSKESGFTYCCEFL